MTNTTFSPYQDMPERILFVCDTCAALVPDYRVPDHKKWHVREGGGGAGVREPLRNPDPPGGTATTAGLYRTLTDLAADAIVDSFDGP